LATPSGALLLDGADSVLLANDSCYGPFHPIRPFVERMRRAPNRVFGITRSLEIRPYLQSYFLHFGGEVVGRGVFRDYMRRHVRLLGTKDAAARFLEVGGSVFLEQRGVVLEAMIDASVEPAKSILAKHDLLDPIRDPAGRELLELGLTPFHKRSNDQLANPAGC
jgi:lipopolysaccharide biosynthesis protein